MNGPFVVRLWGVTYGPAGETWAVSWMTGFGACSSDARDACRYDTEAEAWDHARACGNVGADERGPWSWVEDTRSHGTDKGPGT